MVAKGASTAADCLKVLEYSPAFLLEFLGCPRAAGMGWSALGHVATLEGRVGVAVGLIVMG